MTRVTRSATRPVVDTYSIIGAVISHFFDGVY